MQFILVIVQFLLQFLCSLIHVISAQFFLCAVFTIAAADDEAESLLTKLLL